MRLAAKLGLPHVDQLIDSLSREQMLEWMATAVIDGWYSGWTHTAELMAMIHNSSQREIASRATNPRQAAESMKWPTGHELAEKLMTFEKKGPEKMTIADAKVQLQRMYG